MVSCGNKVGWPEDSVMKERGAAQFPQGMGGCHVRSSLHVLCLTEYVWSWPVAVLSYKRVFVIFSAAGSLDF